MYFGTIEKVESLLRNWETREGVDFEYHINHLLCEAYFFYHAIRTLKMADKKYKALIIIQKNVANLLTTAKTLVEKWKIEYVDTDELVETLGDLCLEYRILITKTHQYIDSHELYDPEFLQRKFTTALLRSIIGSTEKHTIDKNSREFMNHVCDMVLKNAVFDDYSHYATTDNDLYGAMMESKKKMLPWIEKNGVGRFPKNQIGRDAIREYVICCSAWLKTTNKMVDNRLQS